LFSVSLVRVDNKCRPFWDVFGQPLEKNVEPAQVADQDVWMLFSSFCAFKNILTFSEGIYKMHP
jgi:hypothetical protein